MPNAYLSCPSCKKVNVKEGRYCIQCGSILNPVYCSSCGTANPDGLKQCLECGASLPSLLGLRWKPIITVLNPTSAMLEGKEAASNEPDDSKHAFKWLRSKLEIEHE